MKGSVLVAVGLIACTMLMPHGGEAVLSLAGGLLLLSPLFLLIWVLIAFSNRRPRQQPIPVRGWHSSYGGQSPMSQFVNTDTSAMWPAPAQPRGAATAPLWPVVVTGPVGHWAPPPSSPNAGAGIAVLQQRRHPSAALQLCTRHHTERSL